MAKTADEMIRAAFQRARERSSAVHFVGLSSGGFAVYAVGSSRDVDTAYAVTVKDDAYRCTCPSEHRPACWHRAAVASLRASRRGFGLEPDGPTADQMRAATTAAA
jgi:SWIM zinc finger